jgi:hypothetical protein
MLTNTARVPAALIDTTALTAADAFLAANSFTCNCWITESQNYADLLARWAPYFLLGESNNAGKKGLRPLLPVNNDGTINTSAITAEYIFDEETILPGTLEIQYTSLADRQPFVAQMIWRQQLEDDAGIIRTAEVRYAGTAESGPYESHDLSAFCTNEDHAVKVGAYILAKRVYTTHTVRFSARPQIHNTIISPGDIVRVQLQRQATAASNMAHDYLYQVERITKTLAGDLSYECTHLPVDDQTRSLVALDVANATGSGIELTSNKSGVSCDINSSTDNTIPLEEFTIGTELYGESGLSFYYGSESLGSEPSNDDDGLDDNAPAILTSPEGAAAGSEMTASPTCAGGTVQWKRNGIAISGATSLTYTPDVDDTGETLTYEVTCPDASTETSQPVIVYNPDFDFGKFVDSDIDVTIHYAYTLTGSTKNCSTGVITPIGTGNIGTVNASGIAFRMRTSNNTTPVTYLSSRRRYNIACGNGGLTLRRNGVLIQFQSSAPGFYENQVPIGIWGANIGLTFGGTQYNLSHATIITDIVLREDVPGLGNNGDSVRDKGLEWLYESFDGQNYVKDTGSTVNVP